MRREASIKRSTGETAVGVILIIEGEGNAEIRTGIGFLDHMLTLFASHGGFDLGVQCRGDLRVDGHHSVEDIGIALGKAFSEALEERRGICRYGSFLLPMDEALVLCALDLSGRAHLSFDVTLPAARLGDFDTELTKEFLLAFCRSLGLTLHLRQLAGENTHHIIEAVFKALGRALKAACAIDPQKADRIPSTKGTLI
ncbi:MAG: imidazoleglycerol-phosphate dehydratase HisB [Bacillota bacterium]|nr:imidazoleglycerol-phosphate dehydratase HisB [Bacillota bacterium]